MDSCARQGSEQKIFYYVGVVYLVTTAIQILCNICCTLQDHNKNLLKSPRSIHRIRPRGPSKILLEMVDKPVIPGVNIPIIRWVYNTSQSLHCLWYSQGFYITQLLYQFYYQIMISLREFATNSTASNSKH